MLTKWTPSTTLAIDYRSSKPHCCSVIASDLVVASLMQRKPEWLKEGYVMRYENEEQGWEGWFHWVDTDTYRIEPVLFDTSMTPLTASTFMRQELAKHCLVGVGYDYPTIATEGIYAQQKLIDYLFSFDPSIEVEVTPRPGDRNTERITFKLNGISYVVNRKAATQVEEERRMAFAQRIYRTLKESVVQPQATA